MAAEPSALTQHRARVVWGAAKEDQRAHHVELSAQRLLASSMPERFLAAVRCRVDVVA